MNQQTLRIRVFGSWVAFWLLTTIAVIFAPIIRSDRLIGDEQVVPAILTISSVWLPPLTCFASFWFPTEQQKRARSTRLTRERAMGAYILTFCYMTVVVMLLLRPLYVIDYTSPTPDLPPGASFEEHLSAAVNYALLISPVALAPTVWLTGVQATHNSKS